MELVIRDTLSIAIQAGGRSTRMGKNKALLDVAGCALIKRVITRLSVLNTEIFVISNNMEEMLFLEKNVFSDVLPDVGALGGLYTALHHARTEFVAVVACDLPFVSVPILNRCLELIQETACDAVVPESEAGYFEPLQAIYRRDSCAQAVREAIDAGQHKLSSWWNNADVKHLSPSECKQLDPAGYAFFNVNTLADLEKALELITNK